ncbi:hypothetical protein Sste5346_007893 [Sporothrix stenoceras]|uniref:Alpha-L-rhamnosidase six-hairpin glycosidase domain-containing protein n=1 Tax=Sporothrix stenoceras TaxID=5173 RepID=A0ABR3YRT2_9PEZI
MYIFERLSVVGQPQPVTPVPWGIKCLNSSLPPWRLQPQIIPMLEETPIDVSTVRSCDSNLPSDAWSQFLSSGSPLTLPGKSKHTLDIQAETHSTAFLRWEFAAPGDKSSRIEMHITYSEGYERESGSYPVFRNKADRLDPTNGLIIGPSDSVTLDVPGTKQLVVYEPFWFRTFRLMRVYIAVLGTQPVNLVSFAAAQTNYPLAVKAEWDNSDDAQSGALWDVSVRSLRNCMFDGYSDCPFYEQLHRSVGFFHYLLSGDDRLMRQTLVSFAASTTAEGLTQSRVPSHAPQLIAGFPLYWALQVYDHHLYFGDDAFTRSLLPRIDGVLEYFHSHVDSKLGLVSGLPSCLWQYVDWVDTWGATGTHPDKGMPTAGRATNCHTFFSLLYCYVLQKAAQLVRQVGQPAHAEEYEQRAAALVVAVREHCYDGRFFTDSTADAVDSHIQDRSDYSQHCQVFAVMCGAAWPDTSERLLTEAFSSTSNFSRYSYVMMFYAFCAFVIAGDHLYNNFWPKAWDPWRKMLANNLSTWAEDDVRNRSECHAWGSVPIYELCTELAGIQPLAPSCSKVLFRPRIGLSSTLSAKVALGSSNVASVSWGPGQGAGETHIKLHIVLPASLVYKLPGEAENDYGVVDKVEMVFKTE